MRLLRKTRELLGVCVVILICMWAMGQSACEAYASDEDSMMTIERYEGSDDSNMQTDSIDVNVNGATTVSGAKCYSMAFEVLGLVNQRRAENGLSALTMDADLLEAAMLRAAEITVSFSHTRPDGEDCFTVSSKCWGENIAMGYTSATSVMEGWMNSSGHRANILRGSYETIGIGCFYYDGMYYWSQNFGSYYDETALISQPQDTEATYTIITDMAAYSESYTLESQGMKVYYSDPREGCIIGVQTNSVSNDLEYSWWATDDNGSTWEKLSDWDEKLEAVAIAPVTYGEYVIVGKARKKGDDSTIVQAAYSYSYHPVIKGICQMPYTGEGGGYLIGIESYDNPNQSYTYEMLILDCTLYAQGLPAWTYTTGRCTVPENCLWTIWQPQYGYYWTLFRVYDGDGNLIDEQCYGFANIC